MNNQIGQDNCICFPKGQLPTVHNVLDANNSGQERIVVYFYKNIGSNDIKMYTPSPDKQLLIPDLPYDSGDELILVTTETISTIFNSNANRIKVFDSHFEKLQPGETVYWPIGLNYGAIEHINPNGPNNYQPNENYYGQNNYNNGQLPNGNTFYGPEGPNEFTNPETTESMWFSADIVKPNGNYQIPGTGINTNNNQKHLTFSFMSNVEVEDQSNIIIFDEWFTEQLKRMNLYHSIYDIKHVDFHFLKVLVEQILYSHGIRIGLDKVLRYTNGVALPPDDLELRPLFIGQKIDPGLFLDNHPKDISLNKYLPYIEGILVTLLYPPQVLGVIPIGKTLLPNPLQQIQGYNSSNAFGPNGYVNTGYGPYGESNRQQFSVHQYQSPYFHIQNSVPSYPKLNYDGNWNTQVNQYHQHPSGSFSGFSRPPGFSEQPYISSYRKSTSNTGPLESDKEKLPEVKIEHHIEPPKLKTKKQTPKSDRNSDPYELDDSLLEPLLNANPLESGKNFHMPSLKGVMKSLLLLLSESRSSDDDDENAAFLNSNSTEEVDIISESEDINDGERPDYRIIGGNAATGSGTPLSNKGRSAITEK